MRTAPAKSRAAAAVLSRAARVCLALLPLAGCANADFAASKAAGRQNIEDVYERQRAVLQQSVEKDPPRPSVKLTLVEAESRSLGMAYVGVNLYCKYMPDIVALADVSYGLKLRQNTIDDLQMAALDGGQEAGNFMINYALPNRDDCAEAKRKYKHALDDLIPDITALKKAGY